MCRTRPRRLPWRYQLGIGGEAIRSGLSSFAGVKRRFTRTGTWNGVQIFDDYGHHPVEIAAVLKAARAGTDKKLIAVVQPHRYSRLHDLFDSFCTAFNAADTVLVAPVYAAGEQPIPGIDSEALVEGMRLRGHRDARAISGPEHLAETIAAEASPGDFVVLLGAGNITQWANALPGELAAFDRQAVGK